MGLRRFDLALAIVMIWLMGMVQTGCGSDSTTASPDSGTADGGDNADDDDDNNDGNDDEDDDGEDGNDDDGDDGENDDDDDGENDDDDDDEENDNDNDGDGDNDDDEENDDDDDDDDEENDNDDDDDNTEDDDDSSDDNDESTEDDTENNDDDDESTTEDDDESTEDDTDENTDEGTDESAEDTESTTDDTDDEEDTSTGIELNEAEEAEIEQEVQSLIDNMSLEKKAAQMSEPQYEDAPTNELGAYCYGSAFSGGGQDPIGATASPQSVASALQTLQAAAVDSPDCGIPILYGVDAVHGNAQVNGATVFPHNIGLGASGDTELVEQIGRATGKECRAVGIHLNFSPQISVIRDERWGRSYEGFAETPDLTAAMAGAIIKGLQGGGDLSDPGAVAATAKHYVGDGGTTGGRNLGVSEFGEATLRAIHLPPFETAVNFKVAAIMPSYHNWLDHEMSFDHFALTEILVNEFGFDGFRLSDYDAVARANDVGMYTQSNVAESINAGMDMSMIAMDDSDPMNPEPDGIGDWMKYIVDGVNGGQIDEARVDDAVARILRIKFRMDLFDNNFEKAFPQQSLIGSVGGSEHMALAREAVQKSLVLLENDGILPLSKSDSVVVAGPFADKMGAQAGGWTMGWQGDANFGTDMVKGETILSGMQEVGSSVTYNENGQGLSAGDKVVVVVGERPYAETAGDHHSTDYHALTDPAPSVLLSEQVHYNVLTDAISAGADVVLVILSGRPLVIDQDILDGCKAVVAAWLPGSRGIGVADVLFGDAEFSGTLTHTWPRTFDQIPVNVDEQSDEPDGHDAASTDVLYEYGHGLMY